MDDSTATIVVITISGMLVLVVIGLLFQAKANEEREQAFGELARANGLQYVAEDNAVAGRYDDGSPPFRAFGRGKARNILAGSLRGRQVCAFEYHYTTTSSNGESTTSTTHRFPVWVIMLPAPVPGFSVGAEGVFGGRVAEALGFDRINTGDREFDSTFKIKSDDQQFGRRVLHPDVVDLLRRTGPWDWRFSGGCMISYEKGTFEPDMALPRLNLMSDVLDRIPADAWSGSGHP